MRGEHLMKTRQISRQTLATLVVGFAIVSGITQWPATPKSNFAVAPLTSTIELVESLFAPAPVMAQSLVEGKGKVIAVTQEKQELVLEHGEIKGFMEAMTMGYKVSSPSLLKGLKAGDQVHFTIDKNKSVITKIAKLKN
jgi:Cu/Ag efflux protein CusF